MSDSKRDAIVAASVPVFGRYGYRKTTMDLIARAADVSRPAVYQYFDGKAAVYRAVVGLVGDEQIKAAEAAAGEGATITERIYNVLAVKLDFVAAGVQADFRDELAVEAATVAPEAMADTESRFAAIVESVLRSAAELDLLDAAIPAADAAELLIDSMLGIGRSHATPEQMRARLRHLAELAVRGLTSNGTETI